MAWWWSKKVVVSCLMSGRRSWRRWEGLTKEGCVARSWSSMPLCSLPETQNQTHHQHQIQEIQGGGVMSETSSCKLLSSDPRLPEIFKLGMDGNIEKMQSLCCEAVKEEEQTSFHFNHVLVDSFVENRNFKAALRLLQIIENPRVDHHVHDQQAQQLPFHTYNSFREYLDNFDRIDSEDNHNLFLEYLCLHGRFDLAFHQFQRMTTTTNPNSPSLPNTRTFEIIIIALCHKKMPDQCLTVLDQLFHHLDLPSSQPPDCLFYPYVLPYLCKANEPYLVSRLLTLMKHHGHTPEEIELSGQTFIDIFYCNTVLSFCHLWRFQDAAHFLEQHSVSEFSPHYTLLKAYCNAGLLDQAFAFLDYMLHKGYFQIDSWTLLITRLCKDGHIDRAFHTFQRMLSFYDQNIACASLPNRSSLPDLVLSHLKDNYFDNDSGLLRLAVHAMFHNQTDAHLTTTTTTGLPTAAGDPPPLPQTIAHAA